MTEYLELSDFQWASKQAESCSGPRTLEWTVIKQN